MVPFYGTFHAADCLTAVSLLRLRVMNNPGYLGGRVTFRLAFWLKSFSPETMSFKGKAYNKTD